MYFEYINGKEKFFDKNVVFIIDNDSYNDILFFWW